MATDVPPDQPSTSNINAASGTINAATGVINAAAASDIKEPIPDVIP